MEGPHNIPFHEAAEQAQPLVDSGALVYFKFTCALCGERKMFEEPNTLYREGLCDECGHVTNLEESGVGYLLVLAGGRKR